MGYITFAELKEGSSFNPTDWDELRTRRPTTPESWLELTQADIDDPLRLRYVVPFSAAPPSLTPDPTRAPRTVKRWQIALMDARLFRSRRDPGAPLSEDADLLAEEQRVFASIAAAADQDRPAHPELPLRSDTASSGVSKGGPLMASFSTLHGYFDDQARRRDEGGW